MSEPLHWAAWGQLLEELGLPYHEEELRRLVGKTAPEIMAHLLTLHRPGWNPADYDLNTLALRKNDHYLASVSTQLRAYPGVRELLEWLRERGIKTGVVSNSKRRELETALRGLKLFDFFDVVLSRDDVKPPKPDPAPYLFGAACVGVDPEDCLAVEDSPTGIESALVGGMPGAAVLTNFSRQAMEQPVPGRPELRPVWIGASIVELHAQLRRLAG